MAGNTITNTFTTYSAIGIREDLTDVIWNISPTETPFVTSVERAKALQTLHEWQTDALAAAAANAQVQGDDIGTSSFDAVTPTVRRNNDTQIARKTVIIADTEEVVRKAGRKSEVAYQIAKKGKELKRDIEFNTIGLNQAKGAASAGVAPLLASILSWIKTNTDKGAGGADPSAADGTGTRTDGTQRNFAEASLKNVLAGIYTNSGDEPELLMVPPLVKQEASSFTGNSTRFKDADDAKLMAAIDIYTYDFGSVRIVPNRFMRVRDALVINTDLWAMAWLRPIKLVDLAKTGDATKKMLVGEWTLEARNEAGSGGVFDIQ